jgi:hypothetical protein
MEEIKEKNIERREGGKRIKKDVRRNIEISIEKPKKEIKEKRT